MAREKALVDVSPLFSILRRGIRIVELSLAAKEKGPSRSPFDYRLNLQIATGAIRIVPDSLRSQIVKRDNAERTHDERIVNGNGRVNSTCRQRHTVQSERLQSGVASDGNHDVIGTFEERQKS